MLRRARPSGLRQGFVSASATLGSRAAEAYEARKTAHQGTHEACANVGLLFVPLIAAACGGGWGPTAMQTWQTLAEALATRTGETAATEKVKLLQALSITLQRGNARAVVRRAGWDAASVAGLDQPGPGTGMTCFRDEGGFFPSSLSGVILSGRGGP